MPGGHAIDKSVATSALPLAGTTVSSALSSQHLLVEERGVEQWEREEPYEYKSYPADIGLPLVGTRPLEDNFWTRREVCSKALGGIVGEVTDGDIVLGFLVGGSSTDAVLAGEVIHSQLCTRRNYYARVRLVRGR